MCDVQLEFSPDVRFLMLYDIFIIDDIARHFSLPSDREGMNQTSAALRPVIRRVDRRTTKKRYLSMARSPPLL
jgi:hypothetical protein